MRCRTPYNGYQFYFLNGTGIEYEIRNHCWRKFGTDGNLNFTLLCNNNLVEIILYPWYGTLHRIMDTIIFNCTGIECEIRNYWERNYEIDGNSNFTLIPIAFLKIVVIMWTLKGQANTLETVHVQNLLNGKTNKGSLDRACCILIIKAFFPNFFLMLPCCEN